MRFGLASAFALGVVLVCGSASAEPEPPDLAPVAIAEDDGARRDTLYEEGRALVREGRLPEALEKFREVVAIKGDPEVLLWMGYVQERMGNLLSARTIYARALEDAREGGLAEEEHDAESAIAALGTKLPRITVKLPAGLAATVQVDKDVITSPDRGLEVDPGAHVIVVSARGRQSVRTSINAQAGEVYVIEPRLPVAIPTSSPSPIGRDKSASSSPLAGSVALGVVGASVAMFGATLVADRDQTLRDIGTGALVGGITVATGALLWGLATYDDKPTTKYAAPKTLDRPRLNVGVAPTPNGAYGGVGIKF